MTAVLPDTAIPYDTLAAALGGRLLLPGDPEHTALAVPWNVAVPPHPFPIVDAADADDVVTAMQFVAEHGLLVQVRATGHCPSPAARPTLLIHTGRLVELTVDPHARVARVGAGVRWEQLLDAAAQHGLFGLCGSSPRVGVVGYLTGGGLSPVGRTFGLASDHVRAFEIVTGDGVLRRVSATGHPDLFRALRGGKGALGIVTAVEIDLLPVATILGGAMFFAADDIATVLHAWRAWSADLPEQAGTSAAIMRLPDLPGLPPPLAGRTTVAVRFTWTGDPAEGETVFAPMASVATPVLGGIGSMPAAAIGAVHNDPVDPMPVAETGAVLRDFTPEAVDALLATAGPDAACPQVIVEVRLLGGALAHPGGVPDAVDHAGGAYNLLTIGIAAPPVVAATTASSEAIRGALAPWATGGALPNFGGPVTAERVAQVYSPDTVARLTALVEQYDPAGVMADAEALRTATV